ncbi:MAG: TRAP transporter large permease subunit, partial [Devosia sp.]
IFVMAFFLDFFEIAFIIIPLLVPAAVALDIDLVWFGVMICANMQTSFMHPPFGFALFYLRGVAPRETVKTRDIYLGAIPWLVLQLILVGILIIWPELVTAFLDHGPTVDIDTIHITVPQQGDGLTPPPKFDMSAPPSFD